MEIDQKGRRTERPEGQQPFQDKQDRTSREETGHQPGGSLLGQPARRPQRDQEGENGGGHHHSRQQRYPEAGNEECVSRGLGGQLERNRHGACQDRCADEPGLIARIARAQKAKPAWM